MKKVLLLFAMVWSYDMMAQIPVINSTGKEGMPAAPNKKYKDHPDLFKRFQANNSGPSSTATESRWVSYLTTLDNITGNADYGQNYLWPDSLARGEFGAQGGGTQFSGVWIHSISNVLDVTSSFFPLDPNDPFTWDDFITFTVDSVSMLYIYERIGAGANSTDTLHVTLFNNDTDANLPTGLFRDTPQNNNHFSAKYSTDTLYFKNVGYDMGSNSATAAGSVELNVPMTQADTAIALFRWKDVPVNPPFQVPAGKLVASSWSFKPGFSYTTSDTCGENISIFMFRAAEEATDAFPSYIEDEWNVSGIVENSVRYNNSPNGWNGRYIPSYAWLGGTFFADHNLIAYKLTSTNVGIKEAEEVNGIRLSQNRPNPADEKTRVDYQLSQQSDVVFEIYDMTGKKVMSINEGKKPAGIHSLRMATANVPNGVYYYSLKTAETTVTKKMAVMH